MTSNKPEKTAEEPDMKAIESIQQALDAIESGLAEKIEIHGLAAQVALSPFYFHRLFKSAVGYTVEEYIRLRRLARSTELIRAGTAITAAAMECGFESPSHFSSSFRDTYGMTPSEFQSAKPPLFHVMKPDIMLMNRNLGIGELYVSKGIILQIDVKQLEETHLIGIDLFCPFGIGSPGVDHPGIAWDRFHATKHQIANRCEPRTEFGISHRAEDGCSNGFRYLAAAKVGQPCRPPEGMAALTLPAGMYACCVYQNESFEAGVSVNLKTAIEYLCKWQTENGYEMDEDWFEAEYYGPAAFAEPYQIEIWHHVRKV